MMVNRSELPVGITVLAIDDDPVALRHIYSLLKQCQYQAICMSQAITALELLENDKYKLDLIIIDIDMPGIDGHNLFERLLNLNMGIPIIVSSMKRSKELVIQAIASGACEFLVKPVPIEELQNIWQHAFRQRNNLNSNGMNSPIWPREKYYETPKTFPKIENFDHIPKSNKKIKYQSGEKKHEKHQDLLSRKKCRVVWTQDLHRKFVAAVDKLGLEKAVPKKILELMNDENLTRENVASHLQKYRLFLKKSSEKAYNITSCGSTDSTYDQNFSGFNNMQSIVGNKCTSHLVPANTGTSNGQVYSDIEHNVAIEQVAEFPCMSFGLSSSISDYYNPSIFRDLSGFRDDSLTSCVSISPYIKSELHYQTEQFSYIDDHNTIQFTGYARNGVNSDFSNQLNHTLCSSPGLLFVESAISMIDETRGLVRDTNLGDGQLDYDELMKNLWLEKQAMNSCNTDPVDDGTKKG